MFSFLLPIRLPIRSRKGFTLVETLVAISVFTIVMGLSMSLFTNAFASYRRADVSRMLYEESRIVLERIVKEVRRGTIDYEEYWSRNDVGGESSNEYGKNYGEYAAEFYNESARGDVTRYSENIGMGPAALTGYEQSDLYLISADGFEKTIFEKKDDEGEDRLKMLKLTGYDYGFDGLINTDDQAEGDGIIDTWLAEEDYSGFQFQLVQPDSVQITGLQFFISPLKDPRKTFAEFSNDAQIQPHVTIVLTTEPSATRIRGLRGGVPSIVLQTTVSARAQNEVKSLR